MKKTIFTWHYGQPWLPQPEPAFAPGSVTLGLSENELLIRAELTDVHPMQDVFALNVPAFMQCDAFEIFLGPCDEKAYYELHVTPSNSILQLYFDGTDTKKTLEERAVATPLFASQTEVTSEGWSVGARIPLKGLFPRDHPEWLISFGRYDYTPGAPKPVISTTSPHAVCGFHRKHEWPRVRLGDLPPSTEFQTSINIRTPMKLASLFTNGMVLQQGIPVPIWGSASPGSTVTVNFANQQVSEVADLDGGWMIRLAPLTANATPAVLEVVSSDGSKITLTDILVGEVWVCSGQSNMEWPLTGTLNGDEEAIKAHFPQIRLFTVPQRPAGTPQSEISGAAWSACSPETVANFSAVAHYFARELQSRLNLPIGLIHTSWGGTPAEAWTASDALWENSATRGIVEDCERNLGSRETWGQGLEDFTERTRDKENTNHAEGWADIDEPCGDWGDMELPGTWQRRGFNHSGIFWFRKTINLPPAWEGLDLQLSIGAADKSDTTYFNNQQVGSITMADRQDAWSLPRTYTVSGNLVKAGRNVIAVRVHSEIHAGGLTGPDSEMKVSCPTSGEGVEIPLAGTWRYAIEANYGQTQTLHSIPSALFNGMISPLLSFAIRGAIWYQGESNVDRAAQYRDLFQVLIRNWREAWGQGDFPFYFVQLANFNARQPVPTESPWAELREAQTMALALPNTGMAVAIDIGEADDIHPRNKKDVGLRLALNALHGTYGHAGVIPCGPLFRSAKREGSLLRISFDHASGGLVCQGDDLCGFSIAGEDGRFVWAEAKIDGDEILVSSPEIAEPRSARYGWADNPEVSIYNKAGLPATPFRTDFPGHGNHR